MSWSNHNSINSTKKRILIIEKRTNETKIPPLDVLFSTFVKDGNNTKITKDLIDQVYFSTFPEKDASATLSTLSMNKNNIDSLKKSGSLGVVIEMLSRLDLNNNQIGDHITDIVRSISILTEDENIRSRLLHHPRAISDILKLCKHSCGLNQEKILLVIDKLCNSYEGVHILLQNNVFSTLLSRELLHRNTTLLHVRHQTAVLINKITNHDPSLFPVSIFQEVLMVGDECIVDGYIEFQLLNALHSHLNWLYNEGIPFPSCPQLLVHLVNQIKNESFIDLEHVNFYFISLF